MKESMKTSNSKTSPDKEKSRSGQSIAKDLPVRKLSTHKELAAIPTLSVAQIAATLLRDCGEPTDAIRKAYELLDIAEHCNLSLKIEASVEAGIARYQEGVAVDDGFYSFLQNQPHYDYQLDENGNKLPVPFDEGLAVLIPLPPSTKHKTDERMIRFKKFIAQRYREARPEQAEQERIIEVGERIEAMKKSGIPARFFSEACLRFSDWWKGSENERLREAGALGQAVKRGRQGRVKSKTDKRMGARPPKETMKQIVKSYVTT